MYNLWLVVADYDDPQFVWISSIMKKSYKCLNFSNFLLSLLDQLCWRDGYKLRNCTEYKG